MNQSKIKTIAAAFALALGGLSLNAQAEVFDPEADTETHSVASNNSGSSCDYYGPIRFGIVFAVTLFTLSGEIIYQK